MFEKIKVNVHYTNNVLTEIHISTENNKMHELTLTA